VSAKAISRFSVPDLVDLPEDIRARNFVKPEQMPYHTHTDRDYDVGDFEGALRACLKKADRAGFTRRAEDARASALPLLPLPRSARAGGDPPPALCPQ